MEQKVKVTYGKHAVKLIIRNDAEHVQKHWAAGNFYETQRNGILNWCYLNRAQFKDKTAIDVGAAIGNHTAFFAKVMGMGKVICFEPYAMNADHLRANIKELKIKGRTTVYECAAGSESCTGTYQKSDAPVDQGGQLMGVATEICQPGGDAVEFMAIDDLKLANVGLIKIDVEGGEINVLKGALKTIEANRPAVIIETEGRGRSNYSTAADMLGRLGYKPVEALDSAKNFKPVMWNHGSTYIFVPK